MKPTLTTASSLSVLGVLSPGNLMIGDGAAKVLFNRYTWINRTLKTKPQTIWVFILPKLVLSSLEKGFPRLPVSSFSCTVHQLLICTS